MPASRYPLDRKDDHDPHPQPPPPPGRSAGRRRRAAPPDPFILALRAALALSAAPAVLAPCAAQAQSVQARAASYRIPAGPLAEALPRFADAAGVTVLFDAALLGARGTGGLNGSYSVSEGFARLLAGSGLARASAAPAFTCWCRRPA